MGLLKFLDEDQERGPILLTTHEYVDGDGLGSALALYGFLKKRGYEVYIGCKDRVPEKLDFLPYSKEVIQLPNNSFYNSIIIVDCSSLGDLGVKVKGARVMRIDHHMEGEFYSRYDYVIPTASATGVIVYDIISKIDAQSIDLNMATCLYTAVASDTGFFRYQNTDYLSLKIASELVKIGVKPNYIYSMLNERRPEIYLKVTKDVIQATNLYYDGKIAGVIVNKEMYSNMKNAMLSIDEVLSYARSLKGVKIIFAIISLSENKFYVFIRSKDNVDLTSLAKKYRGKGHVNSISFSVSGYDIDDFLSSMLVELKRYI